MIKVLFICHGNICRSPMAEFVMKDLVEKRGLTGRIAAASAATSTEELGHPVHQGTRRKLQEHGISCAGKTARQLTRGDYAAYDYLVGMDEYNMHNIYLIVHGDPQQKLHKLLNFCGEDGDVADPWYTGNFDATWRDVTRGCEAMLDWLEKKWEKGDS